MPPSIPDQVLLTCPHCGHQQTEPRTAYSTVCKKCRRHFLVQEVLKPAPKAVVHAPERRRIACFDCQAELEVAVSAVSTMCKRCGRHIDLADYEISSVVSKNFKTKGAYIVKPKGYVFNTEVIASDAVIEGRFHGKLVVEHSLTLYSTAELKGSFKTDRLIIPAANHFRWKEPIRVGSAEIAGELVADLGAERSILLRSTARMFGDLQALNLVIESGAVVVGNLRIGLNESAHAGHERASSVR